jgi:outer membrane protein OmpA-like peptidoglycan-associated protein
MIETGVDKGVSTMFRGLTFAAGAAAALCFATAARADDDLWRSQLEVGSFDVFHKANSEAFDLQIRPGWRLWDFGVFAGGMVTTKSALYGYGGFTLDVHLTDNIVIKADEAVGYYSRGSDKVLAFGSPAEFRSGIGAAWEFDNGWQLGAAIHHISNAGLDKKNPGVEIAAITLAIPLWGKSSETTETAASAPAAPPPAPVAAPAPLNYLVFFDFNRSDLTGDARKIIHEAADHAAKAGTTKLTVTGHTDTVGSDAYNMRLSRRRALSVQKELVHDGVPAGEIAIFAKGKRELLVPTADGVKEPQNRRVQIVLE